MSWISLPAICWVGFSMLNIQVSALRSFQLDRIKLLNEDENASEIAYKVGEQPFCLLKSVIKYKIISSYNNTCIDPENCVSCKSGNIDSVEGI